MIFFFLIYINNNNNIPDEKWFFEFHFCLSIFHQNSRRIDDTATNERILFNETLVNISFGDKRYFLSLPWILQHLSVHLKK